MLESSPKWLPHLYAIHEADGLTLLCISGIHDSEVMQFILVLNTRKGKLGFESGSACPMLPLFYTSTNVITKSLGKWQGKEHFNTTLAPSLFHVFFQSFSKGGWLVVRLLVYKEST